MYKYIYMYTVYVYIYICECTIGRLHLAMSLYPELSYTLGLFGAEQLWCFFTENIDVYSKNLDYFQLPNLDEDMEVALLLKVVKGAQYQWRSQM